MTTVLLRRLAALAFAMLSAAPAVASDLTIAAASDLRFALDEVLSAFRAEQPGRSVDVIYGASGKLSTQIRHGAPFDVFLSADVAFPRALQAEGLTAGPVRLYAVGRLVLWSRDATRGRRSLTELAADPSVRRFAIANPRHAPYGQRAVEVLQHAGVWASIEPRLVLGENIAQAAQFVDSGAADAGLVALSLVLAPAASGRGAWTLIPAQAHRPLEQGHVVLRRAAGNALAAAFVAHLDSAPVRAMLQRHGFALPAPR